MAVTFLGGLQPYTSSYISGALPNSNTANFSWTYAAPTVGNLNIGWVLAKQYIPVAPYKITPNAPAGWDTLGSIASGAVAPGNGTGSITLSLFSKVNSGSEPVEAWCSWNEYQSPAYYANYGFQRTAGAGWIASAAFGADTSTATTAVAATCTTAPRFRTGDYGLLVVGLTAAGATISSTAITIPGCTLSALTPRHNVTGTTDGNDARVATWTFTVTSGTATGPPSITGTTSNVAYSSVPVAVVRVGEALGNEYVASLATAAVTAPSARDFPRTVAAVAGAVTVTSPAATVAKSNARPGTITVDSPVATKTVAPRFADISASLEITATTSSVLRAMEPAAAASEGISAPVEVQIWTPDNSQMLAVADGRMRMNWLDDMNDAGSGGFDLSRWDPKATTENLALFNIVRFFYAGKTRFAARIENRQLAVSTSDDHAGQVWQISGRGVLAMLADAALYPEYGVNEYTRKQRSFFFGSKEGAWYVPSEWFTPRGLPIKSVPADHPWYGQPADWPDPDAQWIWPTDPNTLSNPGPVWFRSKFTMVTPSTVTVYASADDQVTLFVDGFPALATVSGEKHSFRRASQFSIRLGVGEHLVAAKVDNLDASLEEVVPIVTANEVRPAYANDSNKVYIGKGFTDGGHPYVNSNGSVDGGGTGAAAFDGDLNSYWMSVGNYLGWSSAYEWVEGTFASQPVTAVRVKLHGGPYTVYVSLKQGGNDWNGSSTVPYGARAVNAGTAIRYVREIRVDSDANITINVPAQDADRIRITLKADWDSGIWQYRWRGAVNDVVVTSEKREGSYVRGGNFAGLLVAVCYTDDAGAVTGVVHRSQPEGWLCRVKGAVNTVTGETGAPGWRPSHILTQIIREAKARNVLGARPIQFGFSEVIDSYGAPWVLPRKDVAYGIGDDYLSIIKKLVEDSDMDVWMEPDTLTLHAAPKRGDDKTTDVNTVILRPGQSLTDFTVESGRPQATRLLMESDFGWMEVADFEPEATYGRVEGLISLGNALSLDEARAETIKELDRFALESYDTTVKSTDVTGPRPYIEYDVGDRILIPTGISGDSEFGVNRVLSFRVSEGDAGELDVTIEADREFTIVETGKIPVVVPPPMVELHVIAKTATTVQLGWTNPPGTYSAPVIRRSKSGTPPTSISSGTDVPGAATGDVVITDTGLLAGTTYSYAIWNMNDARTPSDSAATTTVTTDGAATGDTGYGVPVGTTLTTLTSANNPYTANTLDSTVYKINTSGTFTGWKFTHRVEVYAGTVNFVNCYFAGAAGSITGSKALLAVITTGTGVANASHCTFNPAAPYNGIDGLRGCRITADACEITRTVDGMQLWGVGQTEITNSWIHNLIWYDDNSHPDGSHNDGAQISQGSNYLFLNNVFDGTCSNAGFYISQERGPTSNVTITGNTFDTDAAADINVYDGHGTTAVIGLTLQDNVFSHDTSKIQMIVSGRTKTHASFSATGNVWDDGASPPPVVKTGG